MCINPKFDHALRCISFRLFFSYMCLSKCTTYIYFARFPSWFTDFTLFFASFHFLTLLYALPRGLVCLGAFLPVWIVSFGGRSSFPTWILLYIGGAWVNAQSLGAASLICAIQILPQVSSVFVTTKSLTLQFQQDNKIVAVHSFLLISFLQSQICFSFTYRQKEFQLKQQLIGFGALINVNLLSEIAGSPWGSILKDIGCAEAWVL